MQWTWDPEKERENRLKHGISFGADQLVFQDSSFTSREDHFPTNSAGGLPASLDPLS